MPRYENGQLSFDVPRDWEDRTIVSFAAPQKQGEKTTPNIVVVRDTLAPGEDIHGYADRQLVEMARRFEGFSFRKRRELSIGTVAAVEFRFGWTSQSGAVENRQVHVATDERSVISITATMARKDASKLGPLFDRIFASVIVRVKPQSLSHLPQ